MSEAQIRYKVSSRLQIINVITINNNQLGTILAEMDCIKDTYNEIGMANPTNDDEAKSISATQAS